MPVRVADVCASSVETHGDDWTSWTDERLVGVRAVVLGIGVSGFAAADNLTHLGAQVTVLAESANDVQREKATLLEVLGADVRIGDGRDAVASGRPRPAGDLARRAADGTGHRGRDRAAASRCGARSSWPGGCATPSTRVVWLCVTGTNGKTTTVQMLDTILRAGGVHSIACGNVGLPIVEAVMDPAPYAVYAVELSSFQLHYTSSMSAHSAAVLNVAEDHLDWYSGPTG